MLVGAGGAVMVITTVETSAYAVLAKRRSARLVGRKCIVVVGYIEASGMCI